MYVLFHVRSRYRRSTAQVDVQGMQWGWVWPGSHKQFWGETLWQKATY